MGSPRAGSLAAHTALSPRFLALTRQHTKSKFGGSDFGGRLRRPQRVEGERSGGHGFKVHFQAASECPGLALHCPSTSRGCPAAECVRPADAGETFSAASDPMLHVLVLGR